MMSGEDLLMLYVTIAVIMVVAVTNAAAPENRRRTRREIPDIQSDLGVQTPLVSLIEANPIRFSGMWQESYLRSIPSGDRPISGLSPLPLFNLGRAGLIPYVRASNGQ